MLVDATDADFAALSAGTAPRGLRLPDGPLEAPEVLHMLRELAFSLRPGFSPAAWMIIEGEEIVGLCSLVKAPASSGIDIGYGITATRRKRGAATRAVAALVEWAQSDSRVDVVRAETSVDNLPSQRVLERNDFVRGGERMDAEDGALVCWLRTLRA